MPLSDDLGDRMKVYEMAEAGRYLMPNLPILIRIDGKAFHTFTKGLRRPYDVGLTNLMIDTTKYLVEQTNAAIGYTQSDEISLCLLPASIGEQYLGGRVQKLCSILASMASAYFNHHLSRYIPEKAEELVVFDGRAWNVPSLVEASNVFLWRELDATKNAISMAASAYFSHKSLQGKKGSEMQEMLFTLQGINFNDYPTSFKRGTYARRVSRSSKYSMKEIKSLPLLHKARTNPELVVTRNIVEVIELPRLSTISNRVDALFNGEPALIDV